MLFERQLSARSGRRSASALLWVTLFRFAMMSVVFKRSVLQELEEVGVRVGYEQA